MPRLLPSEQMASVTEPHNHAACETLALDGFEASDPACSSRVLEEATEGHKRRTAPGLSRADNSTRSQNHITTLLVDTSPAAVLSHTPLQHPGPFHASFQRSLRLMRKCCQQKGEDASARPPAGPTSLSAGRQNHSSIPFLEGQLQTLTWTQVGKARSVSSHCVPHTDLCHQTCFQNCGLPVPCYPEPSSSSANKGTRIAFSLRNQPGMQGDDLSKNQRLGQPKNGGRLELGVGRRGRAGRGGEPGPAGRTPAGPRDNASSGRSGPSSRRRRPLSRALFHELCKQLDQFSRATAPYTSTV
ncbi:hypothetical protein H8959_017244 [Pygathrix nigripes]